jgi:small-conductance mechanosensitive channel
MKSRFSNLHFKTILSILFIGFFIFTSTVYAEIINPNIGDDDIYEKKVTIEKPVFFNWTVYRNSSVNYVVTVSAHGFESWNQKISPSYFFLDENNPYEIVKLKAFIPQYPDVIQKAATVSFTFRPLNSTETTTLTKQATILVKGIISEEEENTILGLFKNPLPKPLNTPFGAFILNIILWICIAIFLYYFIKLILIEIAKKTKTLLDDNLIEIVRRPFLALIILYGSVQSVLKLNIALSIQLSLSKISILVFFVLIIYMLYRVFDEILEAMTKRKGGETSMFGAVLRPVLRKIGATVIIIGGFIYALSAIGIEVTALLAGAGVIGLVIAFAAQDTLSNFFSGIHLLIDRPFKIGDVIYLEPGEYCRVENVGMRSTRLYSIFDHELVIMPNNAVANQKIINIVKPDAKIRKKFKIGVAYGSDLKKVMNILFEASKKHPNVIKEKEFEPIIRLSEFGESSIDFTVILWIDEVMNQWKVVSDLLFEIEEQFKKENITIPFPQRTVWLNQVDNSSQSKKQDEKD